MIKAKRRFEFGGHIFRIIKQFSYEMAYEAFCQGYVNPEELIGKTVTIIGEYGYPQKFKIIEAAPKIMAVPGKHLQVFNEKEECINRYVKRTYITFVDEGQERQWWYYWQRDWRGFDGSEIWSLDSKILDWLLPRLEYFSKNDGSGWPIEKDGAIKYINSEELTLQMVEGFKLLKCTYDTDKNLDEEQSKKVDKAFELFSKHFGNLWT